MAAPKKSLKRADGTVVTAQEAYDAFMNTRVIIVDNETTYEAISMKWYDNNSTQNDPSNVGCVDFSYVTEVNAEAVIKQAGAGDSSLVPVQQG